MTPDRDTPAFLLALAICAGGVTLAAVETLGHLLAWRNRRARARKIRRALLDLAAVENAPDFDMRPL